MEKSPKNVQHVIEKEFLPFSTLNSLMGKLQEGESLVITAQGSHYGVSRGKIKTEKLHEIPALYTRNVLTSTSPDNVVESKTGTVQAFVYNPSVKIDGFPTHWELTVIHHEENAEIPIMALWIEKFESLVKAGKFMEKIKVNVTQSSFGTKRYELSIKNYPVTVAVNSYGVCQYYIYKGIKTDC